MVPDDFEFERTLGTGAFSKVLVARYIPTGVRYAVKLISKRQILTAPSDEERNRMAEVARRETRMLLMCNHPNIIRFLASMQTSDDLMYVTELCDGGELLHAIKLRQKIPLDAARYVLAELFSAVWYLHHAPKQSLPIVPNAPLRPITILHRDIKPENIMLMSNKHIKLIDFGTAVVCQSVDERPEGEQSNKGRAQTFCGTTHYMSPELLQDNYTCTASDYWACGCVLYHMLVGKRPFEEPTEYLLIKSILEEEPQYPEDMCNDAKDLISKLLEKNPKKRPSRDEVHKHPFFAGIDFEALTTTNVEQFWIRKTEWVDDSTVNNCKNCGSAFRFWRRRHHCRMCGNVFCHACSSKTCLIPESTFTEPERVCDNCYNEIEDA
ncbi:protein kinase [Trypanosoma theileri]|uniref:non-specific serine/threonine protein kinase n=1 Tax=Trypanosoma theileri TaxID=67003 RepID=A0A1X0NUQ4_9TRYP|nr:protein kinase [Trypanosoma theileri]ORC88223.1 protein kinase [Trypanosoma theileri]